MPPVSYRVLLSEIKEINTIEKENGFFRTLVLTARDPDEFVEVVWEGME